jgi:3',5'-nucleoside bisphosphate phosphatase
MPKLRLLPTIFLLIAVVFAGSFSARAQAVRTHRPTPPVGEFQVLKADMHTHTVFSDGQVWPTTRVQEAWSEDLDVIAISDHDDYRPYEKDVSADLSRPYEIAKPLADSMGILIIPTVEITKGDIHFNALFIQDHNAFRGKDLLTALAEAKRQGAFSFWNHPGWRGTAEWWPPIATAYSDKLFQGIELVNGPSYYPEAHPWVGQYNLTLLGNSDIHGPSLSAESRSISLLLVKERSLEGVREALESGRTVAVQGKQLYGVPSVLESVARAYVQAPSEVRPAAGMSGAPLPLRNDSMLSFDLKPVGIPAWMEVRPVTVPAQSTTILGLRLRPDAPKSRQKVVLQMEVTNALAGPGKNLIIPIAFEFIP